MLLKNYYRQLCAQMYNNYTETAVEAVRTNGTTFNVHRTYPTTESDQQKMVSCFGFYGMYLPLSTSYTCTTVVIGTGTQEPTQDDYKLSGNMITGIASTVNATYSVDEDGVQITSIYTITNKNSEAITIGEIAYVGGCNYRSGGGDLLTTLFERTVLDTPVTIEPSGVGQVTYTIRVNAPIGVVTTES